MKANYVDNRKPRELEQLTKTSIDRLEDFYTKRLREEIDEYMKVDQELLLKYSMVILSRPPFSFTRDQMLIYLGNWKGIKRLNRKDLKYDNQIKELEALLKDYDLPMEFVKKLCYE